MRVVQAGLAGCALAAWAWWFIPAPSVEGPQLLDHAAPAPVDVVKLHLARWDRGRLNIFPKDDGDLPAAAGQLRLEGTAMSPVRKAALISVGGAKPQWLAMGSPIAGLELVDLTTGRAVVRTTSGDTVTLTVFEAAKAVTPAEGDAGARN